MKEELTEDCHFLFSTSRIRFPFQLPLIHPRPPVEENASGYEK